MLLLLLLEEEEVDEAELEEITAPAFTVIVPPPHASRHPTSAQSSRSRYVSLSYLVAEMEIFITVGNLAK